MLLATLSLRWRIAEISSALTQARIKFLVCLLGPTGGKWGESWWTIVASRSCPIQKNAGKMPSSVFAWPALPMTRLKGQHSYRLRTNGGGLRITESNASGKRRWAIRGATASAAFRAARALRSMWDLVGAARLSSATRAAACRNYNDLRQWRLQPEMVQRSFGAVVRPRVRSEQQRALACADASFDELPKKVSCPCFAACGNCQREPS